MIGGAPAVAARMPSLDQPVRQAFRALNQVVRPLVRHGVFSPPRFGGGLVLLETTGRSSGETREVPLVASRFGDKVVVSTVRRSSQWVRNLEADPAAGVWIHGTRRPAVAVVRRGPFSVVHLALA